MMNGLPDYLLRAIASLEQAVSDLESARVSGLEVSYSQGVRDGARAYLEKQILQYRKEMLRETTTTGKSSQGD